MIIINVIIKNMNITIVNNQIVAKNTNTYKKYVCDLPIVLNKHGLKKLDGKAVITQVIATGHYNYQEEFDKLKLTFQIVANDKAIEYIMYLDQVFEINTNITNNLGNIEKELFIVMKNKIDYLENKIGSLESETKSLKDKIDNMNSSGYNSYGE